MAMSARLSRWAMVGVFLMSAAISAEEPKPALSPTPLSAEQIGIYRDFLNGYENGGKVVLNIAAITQPFQPSDEGERNGCLKGIPIPATTPVHRFAPDAFPAGQARLVDPQKHMRSDPGEAIRHGASVDAAVEEGFRAALFTFSEIVFSPDHKLAAFSYSFVCGGLCGHGGTVVLQQKNGRWVDARRTCSNWIS